MAEIALGRMAFNDKGIHSLTTEYRKWDFVTSTDSTYLYINETAKKGEPLNNAAYWKCLADGKPATLAAAAANEKAGDANQAAIAANEAKDSIQDDEKTVAQSLSELNAKVKALEAVVASKTIERLEVAKELNMHGKTNLILSGSGAATFAPDFVGQRYIDITGKVAYTAFGVTNAGDWK
jgi:hypothetical protein